MSLKGGGGLLLFNHIIIQTIKDFLNFFFIQKKGGFMVIRGHSGVRYDKLLFEKNCLAPKKLK